MKKYFLSIVALAGMLFATSCQESLVEPQVGGPTTFTIEIPDQMGTKAVNDPYKLFVEVYSADGLESYHRIEAQDLAVGTATTVTLNLVANQEYDIIFWAQKNADSYGVRDLSTVQMNANHHNSETGAAFYAVLNNYNPTQGKKDVKLTRPFAQLNLYTTNDVAYGKVNLVKSTITIEGVAEKFNRVNQNGETFGEGVGSTTYTYTSDILPTTGTKEIGGVVYQYVSMDYLAVPGNQNLVKVTAVIDVEDGKGNTSQITRVIEQVPVQMNYRTNIIGNLITSASDFKVEISEDWAGEDKTVEFREVSTAEELQEAIQDGVDNITLTDDIKLTGTLEFKPVQGPNPIARTSTNETSFVLDLGGKTITAPVKEAGRHYYAIDNHVNLTIVGEGAINARGIQNFGTMTIDGNITITNIDTNGGSAIWNEGALTINNGTFTTNTTAGEGSYGSALNTQAKAKAIINGGTFIANSQLTYAIINEGETIINNANVEGKHGAVGAENGQLSIYQGTFKQVNNPGVSDHCIYQESDIVTIYGGTFQIEDCEETNGGEVFYGDDDKYIAEGYLVVKENDKKYIVAQYKDYVRKLNKGHNKNSTISVSTGADYLPIVAVNPSIYGYSVYDGDTRIANEVHFCFAKVEKETIDANSYKVSFVLAIKDENGNEIEIKDGRMNPYISSDPREHLSVYMNLIEVPAGYAISQVKVGDTILNPTTNTSGNCATGEYWIGSNPKDLYFQARTAGLVEVVVSK